MNGQKLDCVKTATYVIKSGTIGNMDSLSTENLHQLRAHLNDGNELAVREQLLAIRSQYMVPGNAPQLASQAVDRYLSALVQTWHWPETAWSNLDADARVGWLEDWQAKNPGKSPLDLCQRTERCLRGLMEAYPGKLFEVVGQHVAWRHIRTANSNGQNNILHLMSRQCTDTTWLEGVLAHHAQWLAENAPAGSSPIWKGCLDRGPESCGDYIKLFHEYGHLDLTQDSGVLVELMKELADRGMITQILWVQSISGVGRVEGVEQRLTCHKKLEGKRSVDILTQALAKLETLWGEPDRETMVGIWRSAFDRHTLSRTRTPLRNLELAPRYEQRLLSKGWWDDTLSSHVLLSCTKDKRPDVLDEYLRRGFAFSPSEVEKARAEAEKPRPEWDPNCPELVALLRRMSLVHLSQPRDTTRGRLAM